MKLVFLTNKPEPFIKDFERYKSNKNIKFSIEFKKLENSRNLKFSNKENLDFKQYDFIIFDSDTIEDSLFEKLVNKNFKNVIYLSQFLNWDKIIDVFKKDNIYYLKPLKFDDFNL